MSISFNFLENKGFKNYLANEFKGADIDKIYDFYIKNNAEVLSSGMEPVLIKGEVQSGKTNNIIYLIDELSDEFDCFIYLSGNLNDLNNQNKNRIEKSVKFFRNEFASLNMRWKSISDTKIEPELIKGKKLLFFGIKNPKYLDNVLSSIQQASPNSKIAIFDDESDIYTLSNKSVGLRKSRIETNKNIKYISVTATPYLNLMNYQTFYKRFIVYKSHDKYVGLKHFMNSESIKVSEDKRRVLFNLVLKLFLSEEGTIIWNTDRKKEIHEEEKLFILEHLNRKFDGLIDHPTTKMVLSKKGKEIKEFEDFIFFLKNHIYVNNDSAKAPNVNKRFIIGRDTLARGITFKNLIGEYIDYKGKKKSPSVIMQAARWFGVRKLDDILIYMPNELHIAYKECVLLEELVDNYKLNYATPFKEEFNKKKFTHLGGFDEK